ncbi:hypothetical protein ONZ45_g7286 [Pleurotus djamor]|nr:hypothetical protein ONZ45_g7286 [Pleurotus djamor]
MHCHGHKLQHLAAQPPVGSGSFSERISNASHLFVCKLWAEGVLDIEWEVVDDHYHLFCLLAPVSELRGTYRFVREITQDDWKVFNRYASRVKAFSLRGDEYVSIEDIIYAIGSLQRLLPNLKTLACPFDASIIRLFAHPRITSLTFYAGFVGLTANDEDPDILTLLLTTEMKPLRLRQLTFNFVHINGPFSTIELITFLSSLQDLESLTIMPTWLSVDVTHTLAKLPRLAKLITDELETTIDDPSSMFSDQLRCDSFAALRHIAISCRFDRALACFSSGVESFTRLDTLALKSDVIEPPESVHRLLAMIKQKSPSLTDFELESTEYSPATIGPFDQPLSFDDLRPLLDLRHLSRLIIIHPYPLQLTSQDLKTLTETMKDLTVLFLNPTPSRPTHANLHISALSALYTSTNDPEYNLQNASLYVNTSPTGFPEVDKSRILKGLKYISFGCSPITKEADGLNIRLGHRLSFR